MQILLGVIAGVVVGLAAHFALPARSTRGVVVGPALGAVVSAAVWTAMTWAGFGIDSPWIWLAAVAAPLAIVPPVLIALTRTRNARDARERTRLRIG